jgi:long-chain acyl-CoA synthetase
VVQVAVVAAPDETWGERIHAFVVTKPGVAVTAEALDGLCREALATYKRPRSYSIQAEPLPTTGAGKVQKTVLRDQLRAETAA